MRLNSVQHNPLGFSGRPALTALTALMGEFGTMKKEKSSHLNLAEVAERAISPRCGAPDSSAVNGDRPREVQRPV